MIVADTSALVAVVLGEPDAERLLARLQSDAVTISAVSLAEALIVVEARQGPDAGRDLELLVAGVVDRVVAVDDAHARGAAASLANLPLLFKGDDISQTDLRSA